MTTIAVLFLFLAQAPGHKQVTFEMAFDGAEPRMTRRTGRVERWLDDAHYLWREPSGEVLEVRARDGKSKTWKVVAPNRRAGKVLSPDSRSAVWFEDGDLHYAAAAGREPRRLTRNQDHEQNPIFSPNGRSIAFTRAGDLHVIDLKSGRERKLTHDGSDTVSNGYSSWVYHEEIFGRRLEYRCFWWSPNNKYLVFMRFDDANVPTFPIFHDAGIYGRLEQTRYPKVGGVNPTVRAGIIHVASGKTTWLDVPLETDEYLAWPIWTPESDAVLIQSLNRDQNHLKLYRADLKGRAHLIHQEKQESWVEFYNDLTCLPDGSGFLFRSSEDGWYHLYHHDMSGRRIGRLTRGEWSLDSIMGVDQKRGMVYGLGGKTSSLQRNLIAVSLDGGGSRVLGKQQGYQSIKPSPGFNWFIRTYSDPQQPGLVSLLDHEGREIRELADRKNPAAAQYDHGKTELFHIPTEDGYQLPASWVKPGDFNPGKRYGVIFQIYSGPDQKSVQERFINRWSRVWYANQGVLILAVDHRASGHFGKKGIAQVHGELGRWELADLSAAARWLVEQGIADPERIGIQGFSYGGYMALTALTRGEGLFTHAIAGGPVTDWRLYDSVYTERYMGLPERNPEGYRQSSVLTHVSDMRGHLRLIHGALDDNVHLQHSMQLVEALTLADVDFELMIYPSSRHAIKRREHYQRGNHKFWFRHFLDRPHGPREGSRGHP